MACSAIEYGEYSGTFATRIFNSLAFLMSILSYPADRAAINLTPAFFSSSITDADASSAVKIEIVSKPSANFTVDKLRGCFTKITLKPVVLALSR